MIHTLQLRLTPDVAAVAERLRRWCADELSVDARTVYDVCIRRRSIDARQRQIYVNLTVDVYINEKAPLLNFEPIVYPDVETAATVVVVGAGPGGLFAALRLIELGLRPLLLERGKDVHERRRDIALISRQHILNPESNNAFGEGGAGAFSDGKLYTRSKKRGSVERILRIFCQHGAKSEILADAHPHIGTDKLPGIIEQMRRQIIMAGGEVHFNTRVDELLFRGNEVVGARAADGREFQGPVILATGHSARDVYTYLNQSPVRIEEKGLAIGVRIEHSSHLIDQIQYHNKEGRGKYLPAAEYSYVTQAYGRGVYSFCMCPGGTVVPAASGPEEVVVNGMSPSNRGSAWSNSGMVVETRPEDLEGELAAFLQQHEIDGKASGELRMMHFLQALEKDTWREGGRTQCAPAQRMEDFVNGRLSYDLPRTSYTPGVVSSPLHFWMPRFLSRRLAEGFRVFGKKSRGYLTNDALLIASETRTSSPVRIVRDRESLAAVDTPGLFPCGEGAGYAGGIVSSAIDGERCAEAVAKFLATEKGISTNN